MKNKLFVASIITFLLLSIISFWMYSSLRKSEKSTLKTSGAFEALEFWSAQRAYPYKTIPDAGHFKAFKESRRLLKSTLDKSLSVEPWRSIGPHNIGGRTNAVVMNPLNPNTIYAGSASGGLWRSRTGGMGTNAWERIHTGFPVLGVSSIAIAPDDTNTIYIGTGEVYHYQNALVGLDRRPTRGTYGIGILKSTDGGKTWTKSLDWSYNQQRGVQVVEIDPLNSNIVWAGTTEGTYKSTDSGATWTQVDSTIMVMDLVINPDDPNTVFIACGNFRSEGHGIYRTTDGGETWTKLTNGLPETFGGKPMLAIYKSSPNVLFASIGNGWYWGAGTWLCKSTDNGDTWAEVSTKDYAAYQGWYAHFVGVNPIDSSQVICGGVDLWKSVTGGTNLEQKSFFDYYNWASNPGDPEGPPNYAHADFHAIAYHPTNPNIIYFGGDGGVWRSEDGGETFRGCNGGYQITQFYNGFSSAQTDSLLAMGGMQDNWTAIYEGTTSWRRVLNGDGCWTAIHPTNPDTMYGSYQYLYILKSTDRGKTWSAMGDISLPTGSRTCFIAPFIMCQSDPQVLYAGRSYVYKSTDGGNTWTATNGGAELDGNPVLSLAASAYNSDVVYAGTAPRVDRPGIFRTTNGGISWENITGNLPDRYPVDIAVDPNNDAIVYVAFSGFGTSHVFKSTDGGNNWQDIGGGLPDVPTSAIVVDPLYHSNIYVGNDIGVYVSIDGGNSWETFQEGLPEAVIVMDLSISPTNRVLRAVTHGNGVFERKLLDFPASTWNTQVSGTGSRLYSVHALSDLVAWVAGRDGAILRTTDGGEVWTNVGGELDTLNIYNIEGLDANTALVAGVLGKWSEGTNTAYIYRTSDGGASWTGVFEQAGGWLNDVTMFNQSDGIAIGDPVDGIWTILKTTDGGNTWVQIPGAPTAIEGEWSYPTAVTWVNNSTGWFGTNAPRAYHTTDGGTTWSAVSVPLLSRVSTIAFNQAGIGLAGGGGQLARTIDGGANWQTISTPITGTIYYILFYNDIFWLLMENAIYKSMDDGLTWELEITADAKLRHLSFTWTHKGIYGWAVGNNGVILKYAPESSPVLIEGERFKPKQFVLRQNYPNPFNLTTTIRFSLPKSGYVTLEVYNIIGQKVETLISGELTAGEHNVRWNAEGLTSGIYFYRLRVGNPSGSSEQGFFETKKLILLK